jgi:membrane peptidoglycan carboxypeptidase
LASYLELDGWNGENAIAAKTGTTDSVRDSWTVGFSPLYTTAVWVGNTDNTPMYDTATGASAAAPIWKSIMTSIHEGKEPVALSKEGLEQVRLSRSTGFPVTSGGYIEYLTPTQIEVLAKAQAILAKPEYDPSKSSIFTSRSSIVPRSVEINILDGQLADTARTLDKYTSSTTCVDSVSEFPLDAAWRAGVAKSTTCPSEKSTQNQVAEVDNIPSITTNLAADSTFVNAVSVGASSTGNSSKIIQKISIYINGSEVAGILNSNTLTYTLPEALIGTTVSVRILVVDSWGISNEVTIPTAKLESI